MKNSEQERAWPGEAVRRANTQLFPILHPLSELCPLADSGSVCFSRLPALCRFKQFFVICLYAFGYLLCKMPFSMPTFLSYIYLPLIIILFISWVLPFLYRDMFSFSRILPLPIPINLQSCSWSCSFFFFFLGVVIYYSFYGMFK